MNVNLKGNIRKCLFGKAAPPKGLRSCSRGHLSTELEAYIKKCSFVSAACRLPFPVLSALLDDCDRDRSSQLLNQWRLMQGALPRAVPGCLALRDAPPGVARQWVTQWPGMAGVSRMASGIPSGVGGVGRRALPSVGGAAGWRHSPDDGGHQRQPERPVPHHLSRPHPTRPALPFGCSPVGVQTH